MTEAKLNGVFDPEAMSEAGIYPEIWDPVGWRHKMSQLHRLTPERVMFFSFVGSHMQPTEFRGTLDLASSVGTTVDAYAQDEGYWHLFVALRLGGTTTSLVFTTEGRSAGYRFEVFPISVQSLAEAKHAWRSLPRSMLISSAVPLWRCESVEAGATGETMGLHPSTQYAGRGPAPSTALVSARVLAGVLLEGSLGEQLVIAASDSAPFNVELFSSEQAVKRALENFEPVRPNK